MQEITTIRSCGKCGRTAVAPELGVLTGRTGQGTAGSRGQMTCDSIWFCAPCETAKRAEDTSELTTAALRWLAMGGTLAVAVLTSRHNRTHALTDLVNAQWGTRRTIDEATGEITERVPGAYQRMLTNQAFRRHIGPAVGYIGMARNPEITRSQDAGWHPHLNNMSFLGGRLAGTPANGELVHVTDPETGQERCTFKPTDEAIEAWKDWMRTCWQDSLRAIDPAYTPSTECRRANCDCEGKGHGIKFAIITSPDDEALIKYLTKNGDKPVKSASVADDVETARKSAAEVAYTSAKNAGRGSMTPFQFLDRLWAIEHDGVPADEAPGYGTPAQLRAWWAESEGALHGRRAFEMTRGLKRHTGLTDEDKYRFAELRKPFVAGVVLTADAHAKVTQAGEDFTVIEAVRTERESTVPELVTYAGGHADHVRMVDEAGCAEFTDSLSEVMKAKAKARLTEAEALLRGMERIACPKCSGTGHLERYEAIAGGQCFACNGNGWTYGDPADDSDDDE